MTAVMAEKQESGERSGGNSDMFGFGFSQATEAVEKLRAVADEASRSIKEFSQASAQWASEKHERAHEMAKQLREQGGRAAGTVSEAVERNPLTSVAVAFAVGFLLASMIRRAS
jgi:ElaB/YqjD/DUF883 family membrane-anchored ribosome-binding protein